MLSSRYTAMPFTITSKGEFTGGPASGIAIALCEPDETGLARVFGVSVASTKIRYHTWDIATNGLALSTEKDGPTGASHPAATFVAIDRVLAGYHLNGELRYRGFDTSLNHSSIDKANVAGGKKPCLAAVPPADHPLSPNAEAAAQVMRKGGSPGLGSSPGSTAGPAPGGPIGKVTPVTTIGTSIKPRVRHAVSCAITANDKAHIGLWRMNWHGQVQTILGQQSAPITDPASFTDITTVSTQWDGDVLKQADFVAAVRNAAGALRLTRWRYADGALTKLGSLQAAEKAQVVSLAPLQAGLLSASAVSASLDASGVLSVIHWQCGPDGALTRGESVAAEAVKNVVCAWAGGRDVVTAVRLQNDNLRLIYWRFPQTGAPVRLGDRTLGAIGAGLDVAHRPVPGTLGETIVAATMANGNLKLFRYEIDE